MPLEDRGGVRDDDSIKGFDPKTQYAVKKLMARYPQSTDLISALLADVEQNEIDGDHADTEHMKQIKRIEQKVHDIISKNDLKEKAGGNTKYGIIRYPDTAISYIMNDGSGWMHMYDKSYGFSGPVDKEDMKHASSIDIEKIPGRLRPVNESVKVNDLRGMVSPIISIDQFKSKLAKDHKVIVMGIKVKDQDPAKDLSQFIESALNEKVLDVDVSPGPNENGEYTVFVEISRHSDAFEVLESIVNDITRVDNEFFNVNFSAYEKKSYQPFTKENFESSVILDAKDYLLQHDAKAQEISERMKFLAKY